jgi:hypothetical protein
MTHTCKTTLAPGAPWPAANDKVPYVKKSGYAHIIEWVICNDGCSVKNIVDAGVSCQSSASYAVVKAIDAGVITARRYKNKRGAPWQLYVIDGKTISQALHDVLMCSRKRRAHVRSIGEAMGAI